MNRKHIGYARVSTQMQKEDRQIIALVEYGVPKSCIFVDKQSGRDFERKNYKRMLKKLNKANILVVKSIDRLGRNYDEIKEQWRYITKDIGADIVVLDMPLLDTSLKRDLIGTLVSDIVLELPSFVAQNERELIKQRQAEGIAVAKAKGVKFGRPKRYKASDHTDILKKYHKRELSQKQAKSLIGCSDATFYRPSAEYGIIYKTSKKL
ncbi:MAG: recombinase family protein [Firmicutes bacterium]|nr:recombinase family protein [Bacillota bacterium]